MKVTISKSSISFGGELQEFQVYKSFLCRQSPFFAAAFEGAFQEGQTQSMTLEDVGADEFGMFLHWIHLRKLPHTQGYAQSAEKLMKLWKLADRFLIPQLQNVAIRGLHLIVRTGTGSSHFKAMVENCEGSPTLHTFVVDALLACKKDQLHDDALQAMKPEMMMELIGSLKSRQAGQEIFMPPATKYYMEVDDNDDTIEGPKDPTEVDSQIPPAATISELLKERKLITTSILTALRHTTALLIDHGI